MEVGGVMFLFYTYDQRQQTVKIANCDIDIYGGVIKSIEPNNIHLRNNVIKVNNLFYGMIINE